MELFWVLTIKFSHRGGITSEVVEFANELECCTAKSTLEETYRDDAIEHLQARFAANSDPTKLDLGIGVYRDQSGAVTVFDCVREAEQQLFSGREFLPVSLYIFHSTNVQDPLVLRNFWSALP